MSLIRSTAIVGLATVASRLLGFARDMLIAAALGAGPVADAFLIAFRLPNLARRVLREGGLNAGFVPLHTRIRAERGEAAAARFAGEAVAGCAVVVLILIGLAEIAAGGMVLLLAAGYADDPAMLALSAHYTRLAFPYVAGVTLASLIAALLNAERRFAAAALAPLAMNLVLIGVLLVLQGEAWAPERMAVWLAAAVTVSGFVQLAIVLGAAIWSRAALTWARPRFSPDMRRLLSLGIPALAAAGAAQFILLAATQVASFTPSAVSWLYYADRVFQMPLGFVGVAVGLVLLPEIAARNQAGDTAGSAAVKNRSLEAALLLSVPASAALLTLAGPITRVLFERGAFTAADSAGTAAALAGLSAGLPFAVAGKVFAQGLFARERVRAAFLSGLLGILVAALASAALGARLGSLGIGLGASLGFAVHSAALAATLASGGIWRPDRRLLRRVCARVAASAVMSAWLLVVDDVLPAAPSPSAGALRLAFLCVSGLAVYAGAALLLGAVARSDLRLPARG